MTNPRAVVVLAIASALFMDVESACGYRAEYANRTSVRLHVKVVRIMVADVVASDEVAAGLREELARAGALAAGDGYPRVEIEVLRADESSEGIAASGGRSVSPAAPVAPVAPVARATDVGIAARAWVVRAPGAPPESDTGDVRVEETIAVDEGSAGPDPRASAFHEADALRAAARRLGCRLAHKVTGGPAASDEGRENR